MKDRLLGGCAASLALWIIRVYMAKIFYYAGLAKISNIPATLYLFENEYKVPILPPEFAAYSATFFELTCSVVLVLGLMTRLAALPLMIMTSIIQLTYMKLDDHLFWMMLLAILITKGGGQFSIDHMIKRSIENQKPQFGLFQNPLPYLFILLGLLLLLKEQLFA